MPDTVNIQYMVLLLYLDNFLFDTYAVFNI